MLIGLCGKARSGKDTVGKMIAEKTGLKTYAFAQPLKECVNALFGWDKRHGDGELKELFIESVIIPARRTAFDKTVKDKVLHGVAPITSENVESMLNDLCFKNDDVWVNFSYQGDLIVGYNISPRLAYQTFGTELIRDNYGDDAWLKIAPKENVIITDVRFDNEAEHVINNGGHVIKIDRDIDYGVLDHSSEKGISDHLIHADIVNDGSLEDLEKSVEWVLEGLCVLDIYGENIKELGKED